MDLAQSERFREFFRCFHDMTGIILVLTDISTRRRFLLVERSKLNPICNFIRQNKACDEACLKTDYENCARAATIKKGDDYICHAGLIDMVAPIFIDNRHVGNIMGGQVLPRPPSESRFEAFAANLSRYKLDRKRLREVYFANPHMSGEKVRAALKLVMFFTEYIYELGRRIKVDDKDDVSPKISEAKQYILAHRQEPISLNEVSEQMGLSAPYFSSLFKKETGQNFTSFLQAARIDDAKKLLHNTKRDIAQIAYDTGFGSLTHFNRVFRQLTGQSPRDYRNDKKTDVE